MSVQLSVLPLGNEELVAGDEQLLDETPDGTLVNWQLALTAAPGPLLVQVVVQVTL